MKPDGHVPAQWVARYYYSPWRILLALLATIFLAEVVVHEVLDHLPIPPRFEIICDVGLQLLILLPVFHFFFFRPLVHHIEHGRQTNADLQASAERVRTILHTVLDAVLVVDQHGIIRELNLASERSFGYKREEMLGMAIYKLVSQQDLPGYQLRLTRFLHGETNTFGAGETFRGQRRNGELFPIEIAVNQMLDASGHSWVATVHDITRRKEVEQALQQAHDALELRVQERTFELARANADLEQQIIERGKIEQQLNLLATTDSLTHLANRRQFESSFDMELERARRYRSQLALLMFDVDHFKNINDSFGHDAGDSVLVELGALVSRELRVTDLLARWGGEEFLILVLESDIEAAHNLAEKLRVVIEQHNFAYAGRVTCSFGVTAYVPGDSRADLLKRVDNAMYIAKKNGRNRVEHEPVPR